MASPHVAGGAALLPRGAVRALRPRQMSATILQNSADPALWSGNPALGLPRHRPPAGCRHARHRRRDRMPTTAISPGKVSLGEGSGGSATLTVRNTSGSPVTYDLDHEVAISTGTQTFGPLALRLLAARHAGRVQRVERDRSRRRHGHGRRHDHGRSRRRGRASRPAGSTAGTCTSVIRRPGDVVFSVPYTGLQGRLPVDRRSSRTLRSSAS